MKMFFLILISTFLPGCVGQSAADKTEKFLSTPTPTANQSVDANINKFTVVQEAKSGIDEASRKEIKARNAKFEIVPAEWKNVDFQNIIYPDENFPRGIVMKDGEFEFDYKYDDRGMVNFDKVLYFDITGDKQIDALVILLEYHCGAGCKNSESNHFYIFSLKNNKPRCVWDYNTNMAGYEGGLKSFTAGNKQIVIEEFGKCTESDQLKNPFCNSGNNSKNIDRRTFIFDGKNFKVNRKEFIETDYINVSGYQPDIKINQLNNE